MSAKFTLHAFGHPTLDPKSRLLLLALGECAGVSSSNADIFDLSFSAIPAMAAMTNIDEETIEDWLSKGLGRSISGGVGSGTTFNLTYFVARLAAL